MTFFFVLLVVDFMVLNCFYYIHVKGDPSLSGNFDMNGDDDISDKFLWPLLATIVLLIIYYAQYSMALAMGCIRWASDPKMPRARKVSFLSGIVVHFFFIFSALFGVFNRHFRNGGVQLLGYAIVNFYIYLLVILNWPVRTYKREFDIEDEEGTGL